MRGAKRVLSLIAVAVLGVTAIPVEGFSIQTEAADPAATITLQPSAASKFNDTNGDGMGEFEGWGTSLCWWANRIGGNEALTSSAAGLFFGDAGLDMNIGRYNVGGGDHTGTEDIQEIGPNENAIFYDLETEGHMPTYEGEKMSVGTIDKLKDAAYTRYDADFGFTKGARVGEFKAIGWISKLGDSVGDGDNLHYTVNVGETGTYTVKLLLTLSGENKRNVAVRVNEETDYVVDKDTINANAIASANNNTLFIAEIKDVALNAGDNTVDIAGQGDWTLDFVKMAVIPSGLEGTPPEIDEFLHPEHIIRSDSGVPGYCVDVTKLDPSEDLSAYDDFDRVDWECGYAWNYNWDADKNQINVLKAAAAASGEDFLAEAFSNSPPYFMTESGCSSGNMNSSKDNLRADSVNAFAAYMADVIEHWQKEGVITFTSAAAMNEPYTNYWGANSNKQEGCHFDQGESQSRVIIALNQKLQEKGIDIVISGTDETSIDTAITSYYALSDEAKAIVGRIDTHAYSGSKRGELKALAEEAEKNLWMSEVDGSYKGGTNSGEMSAALGLADEIMKDLNGMGASAWILWNAIDMHVDNSEYGQQWVNKGSQNDYTSKEAMYAAWQKNPADGYWGLAAADHNTSEILLTQKYYAFGQFSRYIRPGYTIIGNSSSADTLAAYDSENSKVVIVAMNTSDQDKTGRFDLSQFASMDDSIQAIRTRGALDGGEQWADVTDENEISADTDAKKFTATLKANSITTYIVEGVNYDPADDPIKNLTEISVNAAMVTGSAPWNNNSANDAAKAVDGNLSTYFDGVNDGWLTIDLGKEAEISAIAYAPRSGYEDRCVGASVYGSKDGETWDTLYTITDQPAKGQLTYVFASQFAEAGGAYQYIKYAVPEGDSKANCNIAELKIYGTLKDLDDEAVLQEAYDALDIVNKDDVRGNITLPAETESGVEITWETSHENIVDVTPKDNTNYDAMPAGKVTRPKEDTTVTMTATLSYKGETKEKTIDLQVKAAPQEISDKDYTDYFFAYFAGEKYADGEQIYFASSRDGMNWDDLNGNQPALTSTLGTQGVRDPFLIRSPEGDKFYLIATDLKINGNNDWDGAQKNGSQSLVVWESTDLVNWSEPHMAEVSAKIEAGCTWAPEATYDSLTGEYVVYWASKVSGDNYAKQRVYYAKTRDFYTFTEPKLYIEKDQSSIDTTIIEDNGIYYRYTKNEGENTNVVGAGGKRIFVEKSNSLLGDYTSISSASLNEQKKAVEGPAIFKLNQDDAAQNAKWCLLLDDFGGKGYYPLVTDDLSDGSFEPTDNYKMPSRARHGTPIRITADEYARITENYGTVEEVHAAAVQGGETNLPDEVSFSGKKVKVAWNLEGVSFDGEPFSEVTLKGTVEGSAKEATAKVRILPQNLEYMIDCANEDSVTWKSAVELSEKTLRNTDKADQKKDDKTTWGYMGTVGGDKDSVDMTVYGSNSTTNPYAGGYWAHKDKDISYALVLPKGRHSIMLGATGWWNQDRPMDVYYSVGYEKEKKLCTFNIIKNNESYAMKNINLEENALVTLTIKKPAGGIDPILSWIAVSEAEPTAVYSSITGTNGDRMYDTSGELIQAHGGQIQFLNGKYYWIGEDRSNGYTPTPGIHMYSSEDLYNWKDEGVVLKTMESEEQFETDPYFKDLYGDLTPEAQKEIYIDLWAGSSKAGCVMERPKMLYNEKTGKYVIWFHADGKNPYDTSGNSNYAKAKAGIMR